jgi:iron(III) transport system ATP-binding protein
MAHEQTASGNLVLDNVTKVFEQGRSSVRAVDAVSLDIRGGEFLTLLGPSGCGKTTTLRLIAGFEFLTSGRILLDGKDIGNVPPNQRPMAMVFQSYALFPHLNVFENVAYGLRLKKMREAEIREVVGVVLHMMNLVGLEKRSPNQLSGGQQQRVALARAMVMKPKLLLFDEPLSNLDAKLRAQMRTDIRRLQQRLGITGVYVTHDQAEAMSLSDRIAVMNQGHVEQVGRPADIYLHPASVFVADFIGRANFIETRVSHQQDGQATVTLLGKAVTLPCSPQVRAGDAVYAVIRPEAVQLTADPTGAISQVRSSVYFGSSVEYEVEAGDHVLTVVDYVPRVERLFCEGCPVSVSFDTSRSYLLPRES